MAHKVYRWVDPEGRPTTPPPDPFDIMEQKARGDYKVLSEADERKVGVVNPVSLRINVHAVTMFMTQ